MNEEKWSSQVLRFSFVYNGMESEKFLSKWKRTETTEDTKDAKIRHIAYTDPITQLRLHVHMKEFSDFGAFDWFAEFENRGTTDTPIIENILPLDLSLSIAEKERVFLHHSRGSLCRMDDFLPSVTEMGTVTDGFRGTVDKVSLSATGGRSSNGTLPFMNFQFGAGGMVLAIGWSGQWMAEFQRKDGTLRIRAGMENTHMILHAKEKIRTPRILILKWEGADASAGNNLLRRMILTHYTPRIKGEPVSPPIAFNTMYAYYQKKEVSAENEIKAIERSKELGIEAYWLDACWYGEGKEWWQEVGSWFVNNDRFPSGLKPLGEAAKKRGLGFVLWFEPERVCKGSDIDGDHPEYLLRTTLDPNTMLFNLGISEARKFITDRISKIISESGVTVYRQDFNMDPLPYWRQADPDDRIGMSEIRHIEGLYAMWDDLLQRHPGLAIDNCSSGGRRIDLETISRSFPLWRSDFSDVPGLSYGAAMFIGDQCQVSGLSRWIPFHTGAAWKFKPYEFRGTMSSGVVFYYDIREKDFPVGDAKLAIEELKSLRLYFTGDFYSLHPLTVSYSDWCAYQFDRPDLGSGFAVFLRRHESPFTSMELGLKGIDPEASYEISIASDFGMPPSKKVRGKELGKIKIEIPEKPGSALLRYRRV